MAEPWVRIPESKYRAIQQTVEAARRTGTLNYPLARYAEGGEATGADKGCARSFPVKLENGRIYLDMGVAAAA